MLKLQSLSFTLFFYIIYQAHANEEDPVVRKWDFIFKSEVAIPILVVLVILSGMLSGLTLGLLGLDLNELRRIANGRRPNVTPDDMKNAQKIIPIRQHGNWLLCTLLVGNVAVNAAVSILLADYTSGLEGFLLSTVIIVFFGEILPQATCARYPLLIGAKTAWFTNTLMILLAPIAYPISIGLDVILPPRDDEPLHDDKSYHRLSNGADPINMGVGYMGTSLSSDFLQRIQHHQSLDTTAQSDKEALHHFSSTH